MDPVFDVAIIGGGINGCGCAADAALRGLSVVLFEKDDLASKTSSSSTKLIHGGLRYLEHYQFALVKKALEERQILLHLAPHIIHPQSFILPQHGHMRPAWLLRLGLFFYDHLSKKNHLPKCKSIHRSHKNTYFDPLNDKLKRGFMFYDASTDDARLTIINAIQAKNHGASIRPRTVVKQTKVVDNHWQVDVVPQSGQPYTIKAKVLINAAGPWVKAIEQMTNTLPAQELTLVKGSHIIVPALYEGKHAYFLQHSDNRIVFVIPYYGFSMIGTTEVAFDGTLDKVKISKDEIDYLLSLVNEYFKKPVHEHDIVYSWSGVRPLLSDSRAEFSALSRDYVYLFDTKPAPLVNIYGGKITTFRQLAAEVVDQLAVVFPHLKPSMTKNAYLPGASLENMSFAEYVAYANERYAWLGTDLLNHYLYTYGTCTELFLRYCSCMDDLGIHFGGVLYQVEVDYLVREEWAQDAEDILTRRTKLVLVLRAEERKQLDEYLRPEVL